MMDLSDKSAVITGSSRGIGASCAYKFAKLGADVMINHSSKSSKDEAEQLAKDLENINNAGEIGICQADVSIKSEADKLIEKALYEFDNVDILVNNAGINRDNFLMRMSEKDWKRVMEVNLDGVYHCSRAAIRKMMKSRWGRIINMTSIVASIGNPGQTNYSAAKAGIVGFTKSLAREVASRNITVNAVSPGLISTDMTASMPEKAKESLMEKIPLNRAGNPEEVADSVVFLASDLAKYITGEVIKVSGGLGI